MKNLQVFYRLVVGTLAITWALGAAAQTVSAVDDSQLRKALAERDAIIIDLINRVEALERRLAARDAEAGRTTPEPDPETAPADGRTGAGLVVDELAAERALERGLVQRGVRLLRAGQVQVAPAGSYARLERDTPALSGSGVPGERQRQTDIINTSLQARLGLPFDTQLEVSLPYRHISIDRKTLFDGAVRPEGQDSGAGWGNARVGIAKRLLQESAWRPELVGRITWLTGSGDEEDGNISLGGGYSGFGLDLNATWRRDPLVLLLGTGYFRYDDDGLQPGDTVNLSVGASLALSPEAALTISLDQRFADDFRVDGRPLPGTDQVTSLLNFSFSTLLGRGSLLQVNTGVGLTPDAPDYVFGVSLPFDAGFLW